MTNGHFKTTTTKGKPAYVVDGYTFIIEKILGDKTIWTCDRKRHGLCKSRLHTINDRIVNTLGSHNHEPIATASELMAARAQMCEEAKSSSKSTHEIIAVGVSHLTNQAIASMPDLHNVKRTIRRIRQKAQNPNALPSSLETLSIPPDLTKTMSDRTFLQYDSGPKSTRVLIFSTRKQLKMLERSSRVFVDGTFSVVPSLFFQLYTIQCEYLDNICPVVYALLPGKKRRFYDEVMKVLTDLKPNLNPSDVTMDFEPAALISLRTSFPQATIYGCFFHLSQSVYRAVVRFGLKTDYTDDHTFAQQIRALPALAFLPVDQVIATFEELKDQFPIKGQPLLSYFEETYIGEKIRGHRSRKKPRFDINLWNVHENTIQRQHRTNNVLEGWNNRFSALVNCDHPNMWKFLDLLKKEQAYVEAQIVQAEAGVRRPKHVLTERQQKRILNILKEPSTTNLEKILALAMNIALKSA